jgi:NAD(P)-dependent dehydrogenase (short-subunit alcohol dehydrogenase family)
MTESFRADGVRVLITGGTSGLGAAMATALLDAGATVAITSRDVDRAEAVARELGTSCVGAGMDVRDEEDVVRGVDRLVDELGGLDVLVNNAGISGGRIPPREVTPDVMRRVLETNVVGVVRVTQAFVPLLERSANPVIVNVSSGMGSLAVTTDPERLESTIVGLAYPTSKSAVNMLTTQYAKALPGMRVNAVDPGYTGTDFNEHRGTQTVQEGVEAIVAMAQIGADGPSGTFVGRHGTVPW